MRLPKTLSEVKNETHRLEGSTYPGVSLVEMELRPGYEWAKEAKIDHMLALNEAHLLMLVEQGIISQDSGKRILTALEEIEYDSYKGYSYTGEYEDLFFEIEADLIRRTDGEGGNLHLGRSRNDMSLCMTRMVIRKEITELFETFVTLLNTVLRFSEAHKDTLYVVHTHTQHAQPSVLGHYFLGALDVLFRDFTRLQRAYEQINLSPMGAAAITTSGFPLDRKFVSDLIGCDDFIDNSYDAIGNIDFCTETASAIGLCALNLGRIVTDMTLWATEELHMIRVADGYISTSSIMPQKRNPIALEHLRANLSLTKGSADSVLLGFLKSPYGDISDYEDAEPIMVQAIRQLKQNYKLFNAVLATTDVDVETLKKRALESFSVVTEMADELFRSYNIPFRKAHHLVARLVKEAQKEGYDLRNLDESFFATVYELELNKPFDKDFGPIKNSLDPLTFVLKRDVAGGTSVQAMSSMVSQAEENLNLRIDWLKRIIKQQEKANYERKELVATLLDD